MIKVQSWDPYARPQELVFGGEAQVPVFPETSPSDSEVYHFLEPLH